jgi:clan AA aspartic protease
VDASGRALIDLQLKYMPGSQKATLTAWIDTAFDGELVASSRVIADLGLQQSAAVEATLADGSKVILETFECQVDWFGQLRRVEVIANEGRLPFLGVGLLQGRILTIDYQQSTLELE